MSATTTPPPTQTPEQFRAALSDLSSRFRADLNEMRATATALNNGYAHSGLTNPRADRMTAHADGVESVLVAFEQQLASSGV